MFNLFRYAVLAAVVASPLSPAACSKETPAPVTEQSAAAAESNVRRLATCELVTAAEMSKILGKTVTAEQADRTTGRGACEYAPAEGFTPRVELNFEEGGAEAQAIAAGFLGGLEKGMVNRFEGIGDSANSIGPMIYIRRGDDLISLIIFGADDDAVVARSIYALASSRLPKVDPAAAGKEASASSEALQTAAVALGQFAPGSSGAGGAADLLKVLGAMSGDSAVAGLPVDPRSVDPKTTATASRGSAVALDRAEHIPLIQGLTITRALSMDVGDYEPIMQVTAVRADSYDLVVSAHVPGDDRPLSVLRRVRNDDQRGARTMRDWFGENDDEEYPGTSPYFTSALVDDLRSRGSTPFTSIDTDRTLYRFGVFRTLTGTLTRIDREPVRLDVLVNGKVERLPAIHARATLADRGGTTKNVEFWVLDDRVNPILLEWRSDDGHSRVIKIEYPVASRAAEIEKALEKGETVEVYGIYFDFGSASIRPQSTPVLEEIAAIMKRHADWALDLAGFTDSIGNDADNLDLSKRRTAAVKTALVNRFGIAANRLETNGHGEASPKATNDTPEGRAQNRRVEITRRRSS